MMNSEFNLLNNLLCVECMQGKVSLDSGALVCESCKETFRLSHDRPIMLKKSNQLFNENDYIDALPPKEEQFSQFSWVKKVFSPSVNMSIDKSLECLKVELDKSSNPVILVVGGGKQRNWLDRKLLSDRKRTIIYSDIDINAFVEIFCDGHDLPFPEGLFDSIITTAVLEHVLYPEKVASELYRVLKVGGVIYSELPFMQQVHEGAYDFTRYTLSGHRRLFNGFLEMDSGMVAGPATALVWSLENFFLSFFRMPILRKLVKGVIRLSFFWLKYFDYLLKQRSEAMDSASCTFFLGKKSKEIVKDIDIISSYIGAKHINHV